jgi:U32 family peptidase
VPNLYNDRKPEILAPAGGREQLTAAVRSGADAVYLGLTGFSARQNAKNFEPGDLRDTVKYCHDRGVKVYLTLNTLITDEETVGMEKALNTAAEAGVDALIVQDFAVAKAAKLYYPQIPLFASTQMAVHNVSGAKKLKAMGFSRVVLARELSLEEIKTIISQAEIQAEVFVHGAHCMSVSGNCYLSSVIGGRSGNRGLCAQPCRLNFSLEGKEYALSLKDLSYMDHLQELAQAGVCSFKIEGRMKRAEYVAAAVTACKNALEGNPVDTKTLQAVFSRSGFTDGYLTGERGPRMFGYRTKEDVLAAPAVLDQLAQTYKEEENRVSLDMFLKVMTDTPSELSVSDGQHHVVVTGEVPQAAINVELTEEQAGRSIGKTGGTPFYMKRFSSIIDGGLMLSASQLNALRRKALDELTRQRNQPVVWKRVDAPKEKLPVYKPLSKSEIRLRFEKAGQMFPEAKEKTILLPIGEIEKNIHLIKELGNRLIGEIPSLVFPEDEENTRVRLQSLYDAGLAHVLCDNIGAVQCAGEIGFAMHGGPSLNILNSSALEQFKTLGLLDATLSFELAFAKVRKLKGELPRGVVGYGFLPLMKLRSCPAKAAEGCGDCGGIRLVTDRKKQDFTLLCREKKYSELLNIVPLYVGDKAIPPVHFETLYFTTEEAEHCRYITRIYEEKAAPNFRRTGGLYYRELL